MATGSDSSRSELLGGLLVNAIFIAAGVSGAIEGARYGETFVAVGGAVFAAGWFVKGLHTVWLLVGRSQS